MSGYGGQYDHRAPVERLINATPERFDLAALLEAFRPAWMNEAVCFGHDPDDFFPTTGDRATAAKALCASCPVRETCLDYALAEGIGHGVWGGLNETERAKLRTADRRQPIDHGTASGHSAHLRRGEAACSDCLGAQAPPLRRPAGPTHGGGVMTTIDGEQRPGSIPNVDGATLTRLEAWSVSTGRSRAELVRLLVDEHAPPVDAEDAHLGSPGDGRGAGVAATAPAPVTHAAPAHVHLGGGRCVYGERCGQ